MPRLLGGFVSPSLRWWSPWWWPLVHLRSFRCRLLDGSHYTRLANVRQIETTQTPHKPLQTLAYIGVSQPHDGDTKTTAPRPCTTDAQGGRDHGHSHDMTDGHGGHGTAVITATTPRPQARRPCTAMHDGHRHGTATIMHTCNCANKGTCPPDSTRHAIRQSNKHSTVATYNKPPVGEPPPGPKNRGRWLSSADAECSLEHFWITRYSRSLHIFSGCNRCCTLHIVYNVPWIDVDGGEASLSHINVWPSTHKGSVRILDAVRSAVRPVYPGRGLYGLVPIILGWSAILLAQPFGCRVRFPGFALGFMG